MSYQKLEKISQQTGWIPEYHTLSQIDSFESHFKELGKKADATGQDLESMLGFDEMQFIDNELRICAADSRYWSKTYAYINANGKIVRFKRRNTQKMLLELWSERNENELAIEQQVLK